MNAVLYFRVVDADRAVIQVEQYMDATSQLAQTTLRSVLGKHELDEMLSERDKLNADLQEILDRQTEDWGIKVANVEIKHVDIDESMVRLGESNDGAYLSYLGATTRTGMIDVQTGLVVYNNRFYFGISGSQMLKGKAKFNGIESESTFERHLYAVGSYRFDLGTSYGLEPIVILKNTKASPLSMDAGFRLHYRQVGWVSLAYRSTTALSAGFGINLFKQFRVAYAYDLGIAGLRSYGQGAHEIQLGFVFGHRRNMAREFREQEKQKIEDSDELRPGTE